MDVKILLKLLLPTLTENIIMFYFWRRRLLTVFKTIANDDARMATFLFRNWFSCFILNLLESIAKRKNSLSGVIINYRFENRQKSPWPKILPYDVLFTKKWIFSSLIAALSKNHQNWKPFFYPDNLKRSHLNSFY